MVKANYKKIDFAKNLSKKKGLSVVASQKIIDDIIDTLIRNIKSKLLIKNVGSFKIIEKKERIGRNPKTKKVHTISKRKSISFIASKKLLKRLNDE